REARIGEGVLDHRHDDQARSDEIGEVDAHHAAPATAQCHRENRQIKKRRDRRRPDRLHLDLEEPAHLLDIKGLEPAPVDAVQYRLSWWRSNPDWRLLARSGHAGAPIGWRLSRQAERHWRSI